MKCKYCRCTSAHACQIPMLIDGDLCLARCAWLIPGVCTNPECVKKAYIEARGVALGILKLVEA